MKWQPGTENDRIYGDLAGEGLQGETWTIDHNIQSSQTTASLHLGCTF